MVLFVAVAFAELTHLGTYMPWSPQMNAWSGAPVSVEFLLNRTPLERQRANVFQEKQCRNCHALGGSGGMRGPALDTVATRLTEDQLYRQVLLGGGNMPAYGSAFSPATDASRTIAAQQGNPPRPSTVENGGGTTLLR